MTERISDRFSISQLNGIPSKKSALLISPPVYDTQYWAEWCQPYGLLRIAALLKKHRYKKVWLFDFMETDESRKVRYHRIDSKDHYSEKNWPDPKPSPMRL